MNKRWVLIEASDGVISANVFLYRVSAMNHARKILADNLDFDEVEAEARWHDLSEFGVIEEGPWSLVLVEAEERL